MVGGWLQKFLESAKPAVLSSASGSAPPHLPSGNESRKDFLSTWGTPASLEGQGGVPPREGAEGPAIVSQGGEGRMSSSSDSRRTASLASKRIIESLSLSLIFCKMDLTVRGLERVEA